MPPVLFHLNRRTSRAQRKKYEPEIRKFAITDSTPGFSKDVLETLQQFSKSTSEPLVCNLIIDQISLKLYTMRKHGKRFGYVDIGFDPFIGIPMSDESTELANHALVFMLVDLKGRFKATPAYFLINKLNGQENANLVKIMLNLLHEYDVNVHSMTYDSDRVNESMVRELGASFNVDSPRAKLFFPHPATGHLVWLYPDPCHMLKNVRNALVELESFYDKDGQIVDWAHILTLVKIQEDQGLHFGNKLTERHIHIKDNKMSVRLDSQ